MMIDEIENLGLLEACVVMGLSVAICLLSLYWYRAMEIDDEAAGSLFLIGVIGFLASLVWIATAMK